MSRRHLALLGALPLAAGFGLARGPVAVHAFHAGGTYVVDSLGDAHDLHPGDGLCETDGDGCTLRAAIDEANADSSPSTIVVKLANIPAAQLAAHGGKAQILLGNELRITSSMTITGDGAGKVIVDGADKYRVFDITQASCPAATDSITTFGCGSPDEVTIQGITVTGGNPEGNGGGIRHAAGDLTLKNLVVTKNAATGDGAGLWSGSTGPGSVKLTASNVTFTSNVAHGSGGGAFLEPAGGLQELGGPPNPTDDVLSAIVASGNRAGGASYAVGGGLAFEPLLGGTVTMTGATISKNQVTGQGGGGGLAAVGFGTTTVRRTTVEDNRAQRGGGVLTLAGIDPSGQSFVSSTGTVTFIDLVVTGNVAQASTEQSPFNGDGGGVFDFGLGGRYVDALVARNSAVDGGGFYFASFGDYVRNNVRTLASAVGTTDGLPVGHPRVTNATITDNIADTGGGVGVGGALTAAEPQLAFTTIAGNNARTPKSGGGIGLRSKGDTIDLKTSILSGNDASAAPGNCSSLGTVSSGGDNMEDGDSCGFTAAKHDHKGTDPRLDGLNSNGGFSQTMALLTGSPAIDAVTAGNATDWTGAAVVEDQRHFLRPAGSAADIGAFEVQPVVVTGGQQAATPSGTQAATVGIPNTGAAAPSVPVLPVIAAGLLLAGAGAWRRRRA